jgi:hypothetical protein
MKVFWNVMIRRWVNIYRRLEDPLCFYLQEHSCDKFKTRKANHNWRAVGSLQDSIRSHMLCSGVGFLKKQGSHSV